VRLKVACRDVCLWHKADIKFDAEQGKADVSDHPMCSFAVAARTVAIFVTTMLVGYTQVNAAVCARGVHRPGGAA
jgi:Zn-dependent M32 family carboxypeptidase